MRPILPSWNDPLILLCHPSAKLVYWIGDPSSYLWLSSTRPEDAPLTPADCPSYNDWRDGLSNYPLPYERAFVTAQNGSAAVRARFDARSVVLAHGLNDTGEDAATCGANTTGYVSIYVLCTSLLSYPGS